MLIIIERETEMRSGGIHVFYVYFARELELEKETKGNVSVTKCVCPGHLRNQQCS